MVLKRMPLNAQTQHLTISLSDESSINNAISQERPLDLCSHFINPTCNNQRSPSEKVYLNLNLDLSTIRDTISYGDGSLRAIFEWVNLKNYY